MGSSSSKPSTSKSKTPHRKISKPLPTNPPTPLTYPSLSPLPLAPLPHHPVPTRPTAEQEIASRYGRILADNPIYAGVQKPKATHQAPTRRPAPAQAPSQAAAAKAKAKAQYQFKPLNEIGRAPDTPKGKARPQPQPLRQAAANAQGNGKREEKGKPNGRNAVNGKRRFGGTRQDRHGEWWVLVLADGRWYRSRDLGVEAPTW